MRVDHDAGPLKVQARVLKSPPLRYRAGSRHATLVRYYRFPLSIPLIVVAANKWALGHVRLLNIVHPHLIDTPRNEKQFFRPTEISVWAILVFETIERFPESEVNKMMGRLAQSCNAVGQPMNDYLISLC